MIWIDRCVAEIVERFQKRIVKHNPLTIRDEKTLSGRVHVGSLRGIVLHGVIAQALKEKGIECHFRFEFNDNDPMDGLPVYLDQQRYQPFMGQPLYTVPPHEPGAANYPMVFGNELKGVIDRLGMPIEVYTLRPLYEQGKFNDTIRLALENADAIRAIYREVSGSQKGGEWLPLQVTCEKCGKVGTTKVTAWDGSKVTYRCEPSMVTWAKGCGNEAQIDPFDGRAKLPWKVEWAAKWKVIGVDIEGAGKDHSAAGGSRQIAARISQEIFDYPNPYDVPYEFFNIGGKKMSSSKGLGASAKEISDMLPPVLLKLLMIRKLPNQPIDFDPDGNTIPLLFDEYDRLSDHEFGRKQPVEPDFARTFRMAQINFPVKPKDLWQMRFSIMSFVVQMPHLDLAKEAAALKGSALTDEETDALSERAYFVRQWLETHAPEEYRFRIVQTPPAMTLSAEQRSAIAELQRALQEAKNWDGPTLHAIIHAVKEKTGIAPKLLFEPLYQMTLGRINGPQMGWFLSTFSKEDVLQRFAQGLKE